MERRHRAATAALLLVLACPVISPALAQGKAPRAALDSALYDFGTVKQGAKVSHAISLRNTGEAPLRIERMSLPFPALTVRVKGLIPPGEESRIVLELDTAGLSGPVEGDVVLETNDPQAARLSLRIQGRVQSPVEVLPRPAVFLSAFRWETETKKGLLTIVNHEESRLEILGTRAEGDRFTVEVTPLDSGQRYQLAVKLRETAPAGQARGQITLSTNKGEIGIPVFTFLKDKVYVNPPEVDLGRISLAQVEKEPALLNLRTQSVFVYKHQGRDFRIRAESSLSLIALERTPRDGPGAVVDIPSQGPTGVVELRVVLVKEQLKRGTFEGTIRVFTNDEQFPELAIPVRLEVE